MSVVASPQPDPPAPEPRRGFSFVWRAAGVFVGVVVAVGCLDIVLRAGFQGSASAIFGVEQLFLLAVPFVLVPRAYPRSQRRLWRWVALVLAMNLYLWPATLFRLSTLAASRARWQAAAATNRRRAALRWAAGVAVYALVASALVLAAHAARRPSPSQRALDEAAALTAQRYALGRSQLRCWRWDPADRGRNLIWCDTLAGRGIHAGVLVKVRDGRLAPLPDDVRSLAGVHRYRGSTWLP